MNDGNSPDKEIEASFSNLLATPTPEISITEPSAAPEPNPVKKAAAILGSMTSAKKAKSSRKNGKLGGRPKKKQRKAR